MKVRFFPLYMILNLFIFSSFFLFYFIPFNMNFIYMDNLKILFLFIIFLSFIIIIRLIKDKSFDVILLNSFVLLGSLIVIFCDNLLIIYLGLELQTFSLFILISEKRNFIKSSEAGLKYFILGALSSGFYLLGLYFIFFHGFSLNIKDFYLFGDGYILNLGILLIFFSILFKLSLFPLHFWVPDIYEGSSWEVISLLSSLPKISTLFLLIQLSININLILFCSIISIIIGILGAINQTKVKRLLAYSSISNIGFIVLGFNLFSMESYQVGFFYLSTYILTSLLIFFIFILLSLDKDYYIIELGGIQHSNKAISVCLLILFLSLAGIPPLLGFMTKWFILWNLFNREFLFCTILVVFFSVLGAFYYLRLVKIIYFQKSFSYLAWNKIINSNIINQNIIYFLLGLVIYFSTLLILNPSPVLLFINIFSNYPF